VQNKGSSNWYGGVGRTGWDFFPRGRTRPEKATPIAPAFRGKRKLFVKEGNCSRGTTVAKRLIQNLSNVTLTLLGGRD